MTSLHPTFRFRIFLFGPLLGPFFFLVEYGVKWVSYSHLVPVILAGSCVSCGRALPAVVRFSFSSWVVLGLGWWVVENVVLFLNPTARFLSTGVVAGSV